MEEEKIKIVRVDHAAFFIADLFKKSFGAPPPTTPVHYVAFYKSSPSTFEAIGYYHVEDRGEYALVGGLCVDPRYRNKGLGEKFSRIVFEDAKAHKAFFAYLGNPISEAIAHRVGYINTEQKHLMVRWLMPLNDEEKEKIITEVAALGPF
jgi:GNAT superfamily N-acetyltransferase